MIHWLPSLSLFCSLTLPAMGQSIHVVDDAPGPGVDFSDLQQALDAAHPGDTLILRTGTYEDSVAGSYFLDGKALRIVADVGADVEIKETLRVANVDSGSFLLRGVTVRDSGALSSPAGVRFEDCSAPLWVEDCKLDASGFGSPQQALPNGLFARNCDDVIALRSEFTGSTFPFGLNGAGAHFIDSNVHLYDCVGIGGANGQSNLDGAAGLELDGSSAFVSGSSFTGGAGGDAPLILFCGGNGGDGIRLTGVNPSATLLEAAGQGGPPGLDPTCMTAEAGDPFAADSGSFAHLTGSARHYVSDSLAFGGATADHTWNGEPGDFAVLVLALEPAGIALGNVTGSLLLGGSLGIAGLATLGASGELDLDHTVPSIGALNFLPVYLQGAFLDGPDAYLGPGSAQTMLP